jgi:ADP-heptose:LPS heptosyltransferase
LVSLLSSLAGVSQVIAKGGSLPPFDFHCPLMSLPLAFKTRADTIPFPTAYIAARKDKLAHWRARLGARAKPRVGLAWSGSTTNYNDRNRSVALAELIAYLPAEFQYVCLQKDIREPDERTLESNPGILDFAADQGDFSDAAALSVCMDLVISVDTSIAHLSGALGVETWVLLPAKADWRWLLDRSDSPWYASVRLYRQDKTRDWHRVFARIKSDLMSAALRFQSAPASSDVEVRL